MVFELLEPVTGLGGKGFRPWAKTFILPCNVCKAPSAGDVAGAKATCQQMNDANQRLNATLPTPVAGLTFEVRAVVDEIGAASSICLTAGPNAGQAVYVGPECGDEA